ncbi:MAG: hypothetical protein ABSB74_03180 [Tepidisphaeraceae bacterium]
MEVKFAPRHLIPHVAQYGTASATSPKEGRVVVFINGTEKAPKMVAEPEHNFGLSPQDFESWAKEEVDKKLNAASLESSRTRPLA